MPTAGRYYHFLSLCLSTLAGTINAATMRPIFTLLLLFFCIASFAQSQPKDITKKFFDIYRQADANTALDYLWEHSNLPYKEDAKRGLRKHLESIGKCEGVDLIATRTAGSNALMYTYLVRHSVEPLLFRIMFYKPKDVWVVQSFRYTDKVVEELEEASQLRRTRENVDVNYITN